MSALHKFLFEGLPVRGMLVRLTDSWQECCAARERGGRRLPARRCVCCWARWPRPAC
jgi:molecular chaperone Hsp33